MYLLGIPFFVIKVLKMLRNEKNIAVIFGTFE